MTTKKTKSLTETARAILEGNSQQVTEGYGINYPSVGNGSTSNPNPVDGSLAGTSNAKTLRPGGGTAKGTEPDNKHNEAEDLGGATPTSTAKENLGAKAASKNRKDSSKASSSSVAPQPSKHLEEDEEEEGTVVAEDTGDDIEISEELAAFIQNAIEEGLSEEEIVNAIDENFDFVTEESEEDSLEEEVEEEENNTDVLQSYEIDMSEHVDALLSGENLSEEFKTKATTIFEAAVKSRLEEEVALLEQAYTETLEERIEEITEQLSQDVNNYLDYVVEQWMEENEIAVESALRSELTEDFISGLRALFTEHFIDIPEEEVNVVEELSQTVEELEAKLNEEIERNVELSAALNESHKAEIISDICEGLTTTQAEKLKALAENVAFTSPEEFVEKIETLKENYFASSIKSSDKVLDRVESDDQQSLNESTLEGPMSLYVKALGRSLPQ
jgi:hypothetical protein